MELKNRRGFFTFIGQCIAAAFVAPAVLPKVAEAIKPTTEPREWFIDQINGDDANDGMSWDRPLKYVPMNFNGINDDDTIHIKGLYTITIES